MEHITAFYFEIVFIRQSTDRVRTTRSEIQYGRPTGFGFVTFTKNDPRTGATLEFSDVFLFDLKRSIYK